MILELETAEGVRRTLERVGQGVRKIVHRINAPLIARALMSNLSHAIERRVA